MKRLYLNEYSCFVEVERGVFQGEKELYSLAKAVISRNPFTLDFISVDTAPLFLFHGAIKMGCSPEQVHCSE